MIPALILSGGASTRMGRPKALLTLAGQTFVARLVQRFQAAGCAPIVVVSGADADRIGPAVPAPARHVVAPDWAAGMRSSLRAGLRALPPGDLLLTHVDRPCFSDATLALLVGTEGGLIPTFDGRGGHPIRLPGALRARLLEPDDAPLKALLGAVPRVPVADPDVHRNVNTPTEYAELLRGA